MDFEKEEDSATPDYEDSATPNSSESKRATPKKSSSAKSKKKSTEKVYEDQPTLRMNHRGDVVRLWQEALGKLANIDLEVSGYYGHRTYTATADFQRTFGLKVTGSVDKETWEMLGYLENA